jgi:hypothetical protein
MGPFDISITFQKTSEVSPGALMIVDHVTITFSPQHFKALVRTATETLSAYEAVFGRLAIPDADTAPLRSASEIVEQMNAARAAFVATSSTSPSPPVRQSPDASLETKP